ncbi:MAG: short-chain dehydrogenase [Caulobacter sp.]|nr:short-chain dehydrogenase [Caulobacter sp.]
MSAGRYPEPPPFEAGFLPPGTLAGQVALVTGGGSGLGLGMAMAFAQAGADVAVLGRSAEKLEVAVGQLESLGVRALAVAADVRNEAGVAPAFDAVEATLGPVTILANNAGGNFPVLADKMSANAWRSVTRIALDGAVLYATEFTRRTGRGGGAIINNSAHYVWSGFPADAHSASAKAGIVGLTKAQARLWAAHGIRVNCLTAGFFPHPVSGSGDGPEALERLGAMIPAGRTGRMQEFGWAAAFLCSPFAAAISGVALTIDGGDSLRRSLMSPAFTPPRERESLW